MWAKNSDTLPYHTYYLKSFQNEMLYNITNNVHVNVHEITVENAQNSQLKKYQFYQKDYFFTSNTT